MREFPVPAIDVCKRIQCISIMHTAMEKLMRRNVPTAHFLIANWTRAWRFPVLWTVLSFPIGTPCYADVHNDAMAGAKRAVSFLTDRVSTRGGYLWQYSDDLSLREGEGVVSTETVWVQPPGTPAVGEAFVDLYESTGDEQFLAAARSAAEALRLGQMRSGGWQAMIEFDPERRTKWAYRVDPLLSKAKDQSSLDDDKTQSAIRFLVRLDRATNFEDAEVHEMALFALDGLLSQGQFPNGGFPQVWTATQQVTGDTPKRANYPETWSRSYPGHQQYWYRFTLNDNLAPTVMETLFLACDVYQEPKYEQAALRLADFLLDAQLPDPQPAWAQQYNDEFQPMWARKFEPPAITGGESQGVIETLMSVYRRTGKTKYLDPIPRALDYLEASQLSDGRLARFYELKTNKPLYFTRDYELTYSDADMPTHYGFKTSSRVDRLRRDYVALASRPWTDGRSKQSPSRVSENRVRRVLADMDARGAWVSERNLRYHRKPGPTIEMHVAVRNLKLLADYLSDKE